MEKKRKYYYSAPGEIAGIDTDKYQITRRKKKYDIITVYNDGKYRKAKVQKADFDFTDDLSASGASSESISTPLSKQEKKAKKAHSKAVLQARRYDLKLKASRWKHNSKDRIDGRRLKSISGMLRCMSYIMPERNDALNTYADSFDITEAEQFCRRKIKEGMTNFSILHVLLAAYVRVVSQLPGINRFISGQEVYSRYSIDISMVVKKNMALGSPDTCIKVFFEPTDTVDDVYRKFNRVVENSIGENADTDFDSFSGALLKIPRWILKFFVRLLNKLDYHGKMPLALLDLSPFHGSMIITSMGSLGIRPIYHHIYNFGNLPIFVSYGTKRSVTLHTPEGLPIRRKYIDIKVVTDERICDGYYYASAFKLMKKLVEKPSQLELPPKEVINDIE